MTKEEQAQFETVALERVRVGAHAFMSPRLIESVGVREVAEFMADQMLVDLRAHVTASKSETTHDTEYMKVPSTWWDHLKADFISSRLAFRFMCWAYDRFGWGVRIRWENVTVKTEHTAYYTCPHTMLEPERTHMAWLVKAPTDGAE